MKKNYFIFIVLSWIFILGFTLYHLGNFNFSIPRAYGYVNTDNNTTTTTEPPSTTTTIQDDPCADMVCPEGTHCVVQAGAPHCVSGGTTTTSGGTTTTSGGTTTTSGGTTTTSGGTTTTTTPPGSECTCCGEENCGCCKVYLKNGVEIVVKVPADQTITQDDVDKAYRDYLKQANNSSTTSTNKTDFNSIFAVGEKIWQEKCYQKGDKVYINTPNGVYTYSNLDDGSEYIAKENETGDEVEIYIIKQSCSVTATAVPNPIPTGQNQTSISATNLNHTSLSKCTVSGYSLPHTFVQAENSKTYTVTCTGDAGYDDCSDNITVTKGSTACSVSLSASPNPVQVNQNTTLTATAINCSLPIKQYTWHLEDPTKSIVSVYTNSGNQNCTNLCSSYGKPCISIGTDNDATNGYYFSFDINRLRCQVRGSGTCSTNPTWSTSICDYFTRCRCGSSGYQTTTSGNSLSYQWSQVGIYKTYVTILDNNNTTAQSNDVFVDVRDTITKYSCNTSTGQCYADTSGIHSSLSTCQANCTITPPPPPPPPPSGCQILDFKINGKDNEDQSPLMVFVNQPLTGSFSVNDVCQSCQVISDPIDGPDNWTGTKGAYKPLPSTDITESFKNNTVGLYSYTLKCTSSSTKDPIDCEEGDPDCAIDNTSLSVKQDGGGGVKVMNLPWWREIIPNLGGFLKGLWR